MVVLQSPTAATKENHKGSTQSYYHDYARRQFRTIGLVLFLLTTSVACIFQTKIRSTVSTTAKLSVPSNENGIKIENEDNIGRLMERPIHPVDYGAQKITPVVMIRSSLDDDLLQRFLQEYVYSCSEEDLNSIKELDNRVKPPVYVYEGYYHGLPTSQTVYSKNPNPLIGTDFDKPAASPFTRAFFHAFRIVNREIFDSLKDRLFLEASSTKNSTSAKVEQAKYDNIPSYHLAKWIEEGHHFGDLSVQIHYGKGNQQKLSSGAAWHMDAANSLLHLAVTLRGHRTLHSKRIQGSLNVTNPNIRGKRQRQRQKQQFQEVLEDQHPGSVYLSSSTLMSHAPEFFDTDHDTRSIAIHARLLYTSSQVNKLYQKNTKESWNKMTNILATTLSHAQIRIPTLAQVESQLLQHIDTEKN